MTAVAFDLPNRRVKLDDVVYNVDDNREFVTDGRQRYVVYLSTLSTRTHQSVADYVDRGFKVPAVMLHSDAVKLIQYFANISGHSLTLSTVPVNGDFAETLVRLKDELVAAAASRSANAGDCGGDAAAAFEKTMSILGELIANINLADCETGIKAGRPVRICLNTQNQPVAVILEQLFEFVFAYTSYAEETIAYHSLNTCTYILYAVMRILFLEKSTFQSDLFTAKSDLILHHFISVLYDLVTDRCSYELYIKGRHPEAAAIVKKYRIKYPILNRVMTKLDVHKLPRALLEEAASEPVKLLPYLVTYNMQPKERILYTYETFLNEFIKQAGPGDGWLTCNELWDVLESLSSGMDNDRYRSETFFGVLPKLVSILKDNARGADPLVGRLLVSTDDMIRI